MSRQRGVPFLIVIRTGGALVAYLLQLNKASYQSLH